MNLKDAYSATRKTIAKALHREPKPLRGTSVHRWLVTFPAVAVLWAAATEWVWAIVFCVEAVGKIHLDIEWQSGSLLPFVHNWEAAFASNLIVLAGLIMATVPIVLISMIWLPAVMQMRGTGFWRQASFVFAGILCNLLVVVSGTVVMNGNRQEQVRASLVVEQSAEQNRDAIKAQIDAVNADLARLTDRRVNNEYAATAANVGYSAYVASYMSPEALARSPAARRDIIVRAAGAARQADDLKIERKRLIDDLARAPTAAATAAHVEDKVGAGMDHFAQVVQVYRPPFVAFACTLIGILGAFWLVGLLERMAGREAQGSEFLAIEDHSDEPVPVVGEIREQDLKTTREQFFDEDGNRIVRRRATFARVPTKKADRKTINVPGGKVENDSTVYETQATMSRLNEEFDFTAGGPATMETVEVLEPETPPEVVSEAAPAEDVPRETPAQEYVPPEQIPLDEPPAQPADPAPLEIDADRADELLEKGVLVENEDGTLSPVSQEDQREIELEDAAVRYPELPAPAKIEEAA